MAMVNTHCPYCSLQCGITLGVSSEGVALTAQEDFPTNRGGLCAKGWAAAELLTHPQRLTGPLMRDSREAPLRPGTRRWTASSPPTTPGWRAHLASHLALSAPSETGLAQQLSRSHNALAVAVAIASPKSFLDSMDLWVRYAGGTLFCLGQRQLAAPQYADLGTQRY